MARRGIRPSQLRYRQPRPWQQNPRRSHARARAPLGWQLGFQSRALDSAVARPEAHPFKSDVPSRTAPPAQASNETEPGERIFRTELKIVALQQRCDLLSLACCPRRTLGRVDGQTNANSRSAQRPRIDCNGSVNEAHSFTHAD